MYLKKTFVLAIFITVLLPTLGFPLSPKHTILFEKAKFTMETKGDLEGAITIFNEIIENYPNERDYSAKSQLYIGLCYEKLGLKEAQKAYQKVIDSYPEQTEVVRVASEKLSLLVKAEAVIGKEDDKLSIRRVWSPALDAMGSPSPDGRYISYVNWDYGNLAVHNVETGENRDITSEGTWEDPSQWAESSIWSPDGQQLAYAWRNTNYKWDIRIVGLNGSKPRILYCNTDMSYYYLWDWSTDGKFIFASLYKDDNTHDIVLVSVTDGSVRILKSFPFVRYGSRFSLSPDGRYVIYDFPQKEDTQKRDIFLLDTRNGHEITLVEHPEDDGNPFWTPDGKRIAFISDRTGTKGLWVLDVTDGKPQENPELIRDNLDNIEPIRLTRNGSIYYFSGNEGRGDVFVASIDPKTGKILSTPKKAVRSFEGYNSQPAWSPDGKYLACVSERPDMQVVVVICSVETGEERVIPWNNSIYKRNIYTPLRWSPDGRSILTRARDMEDQLILYSVNVQTGEYTPIVKREIKSWNSPVWSPDGKKILFQDVQPQIPQTDEQPYIPPTPGPIEVRDLATGVDKELQKGVWFLSLSPDGKQVAFALTIIVEEEWSIQIMPASGGEGRELFRVYDLRELWLLFGSTWTPDNRYLLFYKRKGEINELWRMPVEGGTPEKMGLEMKGLTHVCINPEGRRIAFSSVSKTPIEMWVVENFLPE